MTFFDLLKSGNLSAIKAAIDQDSDIVSQKDTRGFTPLVMATYTGNLDVTKILVEACADVNMVDAAQNTALMGVCFKGYDALAKYLVEKGTDVNKQNSMGATALNYATTYGSSQYRKDAYSSRSRHYYSR